MSVVRVMLMFGTYEKWRPLTTSSSTTTFLKALTANCKQMMRTTLYRRNNIRAWLESQHIGSLSSLVSFASLHPFSCTITNMVLACGCDVYDVWFLPFFKRHILGNKPYFVDVAVQVWTQMVWPAETMTYFQETQRYLFEQLTENKGKAVRVSPKN